MENGLKRGALLLIVLTVLGFTARGSAEPNFSEQLQFGTGVTIPVSWGDWNLDGYADLAVGNFGNGQNYLHTNNGNGTFTETPKFGLKNTFALAWGDFDNDGDPDMAIANSAASNRLIVNNGDGTWSGQNNFGGPLTSIALAWADYDLDGDLDIAVGNGLLESDEQNALFVNNGNGTFTEQAQFGVNQTASLTWGDFDGDGDPDLAVGNGGFVGAQQNFLYVNEGDGTFSERVEFGTGDTSCLVWGDGDNDGDLDLAVANWDAGQNYLYRNDGGVFTELARFGVRDPNTMAWGDCDNDGDLDLAVGNGDFTSADSNFVYVNEGGLVFTESAQFGLGSTDGLAWADYDNDGDLDLAVGNEHHTPQNYLYVNNTDDLNWFILGLVGHFHDLGSGYSNRDAVGAKVAVYESGFLGDPVHLLGFREVAAHGGFASQNDRKVHFGLPVQTSVDLRITWPGSEGSFIVQDIVGHAVPGFAEIHEVSAAVSAPESSAGGVPVWRVVPNPTTRGATLDFFRPIAEGAMVEIVDVAGRVVRAISLRNVAGGSRAVWDGRDDSGRSVAPGVYFARTPHSSQPGRITVLH